MIKRSLILIGLILPFSVSAKPCKKVTQALLELYPEQNKEQMLLRLKNAKDKHKFLRSFIPYYYTRAHDLRESLPVYNKLKNHVGVIGGDCHVENFGYITNNKGKAILTLNDFDDVAEGPLFLDVMRLSQSASYIEDIKQAKLIEAYRKGLTGAQFEFTPYMQKLAAKAQKGGFAHKADILQTAQGPRFAVKQEPFFTTTQKELSSINNILANKYGKNVKVHDAYRTMKESGGSAFGTRYHVLMESEGEMHMVEFKEVMEGGVVSQWVPKKVTEYERVQNAQQTLLGNDFHQRLDVLEMDGKPYQIRFKAEGNKSVDPFGAGKKEIHDIIEDEFYTLGQMHRKSLGNDVKKITAYNDDLSKVTTKDWEESVDLMRKQVKKAFDAANPKK